MKRFLGFLCSLLLLSPVPVRSAEQTRELRDLPYVKNGSPSQKLDLYLPAGDATTPHPLLVWIHGGGWIGGSKHDCPAKGALEHGCAVASIEYRFSNEAIFPAQIEDCKAAIRWLRAHAGEYGIDPQRIGAWGASAGGHLVALLGTTGQTHVFDKGENLDQSSAVQCVVDWFGPTDFLNYGPAPGLALDKPGNLVFKLLGGPISEKRDLARLASPVYDVDEHSAPFLIMQGDKDSLVPLQQSQELDTALRKAGVESTLIVLAGSDHGGPAFVSADNIKLIADFVAKHLMSPATAHARP